MFFLLLPSYYNASDKMEKPNTITLTPEKQTTCRYDRGFTELVSKNNLLCN